MTDEPQSPEAQAALRDRLSKILELAGRYGPLVIDLLERFMDTASNEDLPTAPVMPVGGPVPAYAPGKNYLDAILEAQVKALAVTLKVRQQSC